MSFIAPKFLLDGFHCPLCGTFAHMNWQVLGNQDSRTDYYEATCSKCKESSLWRVTDFNYDVRHSRVDNTAELIFPDNGFAVLPDNDMPDDVKDDYIEAARVFSRSPKSAAALLRLGLQKLCKHLGKPGSNINEDIRSLASDNILPPLVIKVADTVRITGNNSVHPGEMSEEDIDYVASKMFDLLNFIVKKAISEPKELISLYEMTPEKPRVDAENKDAKARNKNA